MQYAGSGSRSLSISSGLSRSGCPRSRGATPPVSQSDPTWGWRRPWSLPPTRWCFRPPISTHARCELHRFGHVAGERIKRLVVVVVGVERDEVELIRCHIRLPKCGGGPIVPNPDGVRNRPRVDHGRTASIRSRRPYHTQPRPRASRCARPAADAHRESRRATTSAGSDRRCQQYDAQPLYCHGINTTPSRRCNRARNAPDRAPPVWGDSPP